MFDELNKVYSGTSMQTPASLGTFEGIAGFAANLMVAVAGSVSMIALAYAFVQFTMAQGDPKSVDKAQHAALYSIIAMMVSILAYAIKSAVFKTVGAQ